MLLLYMDRAYFICKPDHEVYLRKKVLGNLKSNEKNEPIR